MGWEERDITRETQVHEGYLDYKLWVEGKGLIVEAKKTSVAFNLPAGTTYKSKFTIGGLLRREKELKSPYEQVHNYCVESGVQFGCFTNGLHWIIFPAIRDDGIEISKSKVIAFQGLTEIHTNFSAFWNLLSKESIAIGKINEVFLPADQNIAESYLINIDERRSELFHRNILSDVFEPILPEYFGDLIGEKSIEKLRNCYVESIEHEGERPEIATLSKTIGTDPMVKQFMTLPEAYANLKRTIDAYHDRDGKSGIIYILLGRVGSGKSTFLYHFFNISHKEFSNNNFVFFLNFNRYDEKEPLNKFFFSELRDLLNKSELFERVDHRFLKEAFEDDISTLKKGPLGGIKSEEKKSYYIAEKLIEISKDDEKYFRGIFNNFKQNKGINTVLVFDNVDQLDSKVQEEVVKFAYSKYQQWGSFIIISMREETYYKSKRKGSLSTIPCNIVHLPIQSIIPIITKRLEYFHDQLGNNPNNIKHDLSEKSLTILHIQKYIELISKSLTSESDKVKNFLEAIALGDLRRSLEFFRTFLTAGNTDSGKIIRKMKTTNKFKRRTTNIYYEIMKISCC
ncbi:hypothetical protein IPdc08_01584 [archaeon]|nr:hypothetical protein IPdc08_01584 [archaeon]